MNWDGYVDWIGSNQEIVESDQVLRHVDRYVSGWGSNQEIVERLGHG